ncbi:MAG: DUF6301 family protein [Propionibacteriaceae bacterium]|nr:DUF6301 family protein [Propionibacteriaceae bacterium]
MKQTAKTEVEVFLSGATMLPEAVVKEVLNSRASKFEVVESAYRVMHLPGADTTWLRARSRDAADLVEPRDGYGGPRLWAQTWPLLFDAASAIICRDKLSPQQFQVFTAGFRDAGLTVPHSSSAAEDTLPQKETAVADPRIVTEDELRPVLNILANLTWPIPFDQAPNIIAQLGWSMFGKKSALSTLPVSLKTVGLGRLNGELSRVEFRVSDTVGDDSPSGRRVLEQSFLPMSVTISSSLGVGPTGELWGHPGLRWDLPSGGRVNLPAGLSALQIQVWSKQLADVERLQISQGVDPEHNLDDVD